MDDRRWNNLYPCGLKVRQWLGRSAPAEASRRSLSDLLNFPVSGSGRVHTFHSAPSWPPEDFTHCYKLILAFSERHRSLRCQFFPGAAVWILQLQDLPGFGETSVLPSSLRKDLSRTHGLICFHLYMDDVKLDLWVEGKDVSFTLPCFPDAPQASFFLGNVSRILCSQYLSAFSLECQYGTTSQNPPLPSLWNDIRIFPGSPLALCLKALVPQGCLYLG